MESLRDGWTIVRRNLWRLRHSPGEIAAALILPAFLVIIFGYIFGSAIAVPGGGNYREFLMPGLFAMTATLAVITTMIKVARDNGEGVMDRFRSMPMARWVVPFGQTGADLIMSLANYAVMAVCGLAVGWRVHHGVGHALAGAGVLLLFGYALHWVGVALGLLFENEATADRMTPLVFPVTMLSNTFVPTGGMPAWMRTLADWNPISSVSASLRELFGNPGVASNGAWPLEHPVLAAVLWSGVLLVVAVPLAVHAYRVAGR